VRRVSGLNSKSTRPSEKRSDKKRWRLRPYRSAELRRHKLVGEQKKKKLPPVYQAVLPLIVANQEIAHRHCFKVPSPAGAKRKHYELPVEMCLPRPERHHQWSEQTQILACHAQWNAPIRTNDHRVLLD
jgi:hypothetical protein